MLLDLPIYWQHRMHHTDRDIDATTALRFHPIEIVLSVLIKTVAVWMLATPFLSKQQRIQEE